MSTFTRGKRSDMTPWQAELARIYDRLRKKELRKEGGFRYVHPRYMTGVREALEAVQEITVEEPDLQPDTATVSVRWL